MGREEYQLRPFKVEAHGCSTKAGFIKNGLNITLGSDWPRFLGNEDGSDDGDVIVYNPDGSIAFRFASTEQYREALKYVKQRESETGKDVFITGFPIGMIKNGQGDFSNINAVNWEKYDLYKEIYG